MVRKLFEKEKHVKQRVKEILNAADWFWWMPAANGMGTTGISDFCAIKNGVFMAVETKFGKNPPTALQRAFLESIEAQKGFAFLVTEDNVEWLSAFVESFDRATVAQIKKLTPTTEDGAAMLNAIKAMSYL